MSRFKNDCCCFLRQSLFGDPVLLGVRVLFAPSPPACSTCSPFPPASSTSLGPVARVGWHWACVALPLGTLHAIKSTPVKKAEVLGTRGFPFSLSQHVFLARATVIRRCRATRAPWDLIPAWMVARRIILEDLFIPLVQRARHCQLCFF